MDVKRYLTDTSYIKEHGLINMSVYNGPTLSPSYRTLWDVFIPMMAYRDTRLYHTTVISNRVGYVTTRQLWAHLCYPRKVYGHIVRLYTEHGDQYEWIDQQNIIRAERREEVWHKKVGQIYSTPGALDWANVLAIRYGDRYLVGYGDALLSLTNWYCTLNPNKLDVCIHCRQKLSDSEQVRMKLAVLGARLGD